jgi:hypothetical protein
VTAEAGELQWRAPLGTVQFAPGVAILAGDASHAGGRFVLDAGAWHRPPRWRTITSLVGCWRPAASDSAPCGCARDLAVDAGTVINARQIRLVADAGRMDIAGTLNASGEQAGTIWLAAGDSLNIAGALNASGTGASAAGGRVDLFALDADGDDASGAASDVVNLLAGSVIDVSGGSSGAGGSVFVHARRLDSDGDGQTDQLLTGELAGSIAGAGSAVAGDARAAGPNATRSSIPPAAPSSPRHHTTGTEIGDWRGETEAFLNGLAAPNVGPLQIAAGAPGGKQRRSWCCRICGISWTAGTSGRDWRPHRAASGPDRCDHVACRGEAWNCRRISPTPSWSSTCSTPCPSRA